MAPFLHGHGDAQVPFRRAEKAVLPDARIAVPLLPVVRHDAIEVCRELFLEVLGRLEDAPPGALLDVAHLPLEGLDLHGIRPGNADLSDLDLVTLVDGDVHTRGILQHRVLRARHGHLRVEVPLFDVVVHQDAAGGDLEVFVDDLPPDQVQLSAQGFLFAPLHTTEAILGQSGHLFDADDEVDIVSPALSEFDGHVAEQPLVPQVAHRLAQPVARDEHLIADLQSTEQLDGLDIRVVCPQHGDARDAVLGREGTFKSTVDPPGWAQMPPHHSRQALRMAIG